METCNSVNFYWMNSPYKSFKTVYFTSYSAMWDYAEKAYIIGSKYGFTVSTCFNPELFSKKTLPLILSITIK